MALYKNKNQGLDKALSTRNDKPFTMDRAAAVPKRAPAVSDDTESTYKREIKDLQEIIRLLKKELENMAYRPPTESQTSKIADAIDSGAYVSKEVEIGVKIKALEAKLESAKKRLQFLFGDEN